MDIKGMLIGMIIPMVLNEGAKAAKVKLDEVQAKEPEWHKTAVICGHRLLTAHLDEVIEKTENKYDDTLFDEVVKLLEDQADTHGIELAA